MKASDLEKNGWTQISHDLQNGGWDWEKDGWVLACMDSGKVEISNAKYRTFTTILPKRFIGFVSSIERLEIVLECLGWEKNPEPLSDRVVAFGVAIMAQKKSKEE